MANNVPGIMVPFATVQYKRHEIVFKQDEPSNDLFFIVSGRYGVYADGKLVSANYSVIYDVVFTCKKGGHGGFCITGVFNPTPNDTNLEPK